LDDQLLVLSGVRGEDPSWSFGEEKEASFQLPEEVVVSRTRSLTTRTT